jgi:hypothetical protein
VSFNGGKFTGAVEGDGSFSVALPAFPASGTPTTLTVSSPVSPPVTLTDVLVGDVILCSVTLFIKNFVVQLGEGVSEEGRGRVHMICCC